MKTRFLLSILALSGAALGGGAHAQNAPTQNTPAPTEAAPFFRDVPRNHWAFAAVQRLAGAGIVEGVGTGEKAAPAPRVALPTPRFNAASTVPAVKTALSANPALRGATIDVDGSNDGHLFLRGTVRNQAKKALATAIARKHAPRFTVINQLRVTR